MADKPKGLSIIDKGLKVEGTIHAKGTLVIGGEVQGSLLGDKVITAKGSHVLAWAKVGELVIAGEFEGDVTAYKSLKVLPTGNLCGNIIYKSLCLEAGGKLNGNVRPIDSEDEVLAQDIESGTDHPAPASQAAEGDAGEAELPKPS